MCEGGEVQAYDVSGRELVLLDAVRVSVHERPDRQQAALSVVPVPAGARRGPAASRRRRDRAALHRRQTAGGCPRRRHRRTGNGSDAAPANLTTT